MRLRKLYEHPIFIQLVVFTVLIGIVPLILISGFVFYKMADMAREEVMDSHEQVILQYTDGVEEKLRQYQESVIQIANNTIILKTLQQEDSDAYTRGRRVSEEVVKSLLLERKTEINSCMVYSTLAQNPIYGQRASMLKEAAREGWFQKKNATQDGWYLYFATGQQENLMAIVKTIQNIDVNSYRKEDIGIVKLDLNIARLFAPAKQEKNTSFQLILCDSANDILYSSLSDGGVNAEQILSAVDEQNTKTNGGQTEKTEVSTRRKKYDDVTAVGSYLVQERRIQDYGLRLLFLFENNEMSQKRGEVIRWILPWILVLLIVIVLGAFVYTRNFSARVERLLQKFRYAAETGDLTVQEPISGTDEIAALDRQFSQLLKQLDRLIQKNYIQRLENKETELKNLQLQINPHFLYNTLETMSSIAAVNQVFLICDMCGKLGEIFRYSLGSSDSEFVTVSQELHHTENYVFIQKIRYGNQFEVYYSVDDGLDKKLIPRFILQPIVENAIVHGMERMTTQGTLEISVTQKEENLLIKIEDDGVGMDQEQLQELCRYIDAPDIKEKKKRSIGVRNVHQRIKMICGEQYGIRIRSEVYQGSVFEIYLPMR